MESAGATILELFEGGVSIIERMERFRQGLVELSVGHMENGIVLVQILMSKFTFLIGDLCIFLGYVGGHVREVGEHQRELAFETDAGFVKTLDGVKVSASSFGGIIDDGHVFEAGARVQEIDLAVGLRVDILLDQFSFCEFAETHPLCDAVDFFKMTVEKVAGDKPVDGISHKTECIDVGMFVGVGQIEREFVITKALHPGMATNNLANVCAAVLLGFQQRARVIESVAKISVHQLAKSRSTCFRDVYV